MDPYGGGSMLRIHWVILAAIRELRLVKSTNRFTLRGKAAARAQQSRRSLSAHFTKLSFELCQSFKEKNPSFNRVCPIHEVECNIEKSTRQASVVPGSGAVPAVLW